MHKRFMKEALSLAQKGIGYVHPNPMVGAVLVKNGQIIGRGYHERCGGPHAEVNAISDAQQTGNTDFSDTTLYVTLEPCCHTGKTPPCTDLIIASRIPSIIVGMTDPNPLVSGKGIAILREAGLTVRNGILEDECRELNRVFLKYILSGKPFVLLKSAMSLDGKIATPEGISQWISGEESRRDGHRLRAEYTAVLCGINTVIADNPMLDVRLVTGDNPVRIIVDSSLRIPLNSQIVRTANRIPTIVATVVSENDPSNANQKNIEKKNKKVALEKAGIDVLKIGEAQGRVDLHELMSTLGKRKIDSILLEGGGTMAAAALKAGIVDAIRLYMAPMIIGGQNSIGVIGGCGPQTLAECPRLKNIRIERFGDDIAVEGNICSPA